MLPLSDDLAPLLQHLSPNQGEILLEKKWQRTFWIVFDAATIPANLSCAQCGYDLRTLSSDSNCPECGRSIIDSINARPLAHWLRRFRRGVTFLCIVMLLRTPHVYWWLYLQARNQNGLNPEGATFLFYALLVLPAAWLMTTSSPSLPRVSSYRKWLIALTALQVILTFCALNFSRHAWPLSWRNGSMILLCAYALMPLVAVAQLWLLLELLYKSLKVLPFWLPRPIYRVVQWTAMYSLLGPAIFYGIINFVRIKYDDPPFARSWIEPSLSRFLQHFLITPAFFIALYVWVAGLLLVFYCRFQIRRGIVLLCGR